MSGNKIKAELQQNQSINVRPLPFTTNHFLSFGVMVILMLLGSVFWPLIDEETLKPGEDFPLWMKLFSVYTNVPIKQGLLHVAIYGYEIIFVPDLVRRHIGQRLGTLWLQFFEDPRWGQHFHMQVETILQILDLFSCLPENLAHTLHGPKQLLFKAGIHILYSFVVIMFVTNFITSSAYHTFKEQMIGFLITVVKISFDYTVEGSRINDFIGRSIAKRPFLSLPIGISLISVIYFLLNFLYPSLATIVLHPTVGASCFFMAGVLVSWYNR